MPNLPLSSPIRRSRLGHLLHPAGFLFFLAGLGVAGNAQAEVASALLREGDPMPGLDGRVIASLSNTGVNHAGWIAASVNSDGAGSTWSHVIAFHAEGQDDCDLLGTLCTLRTEEIHAGYAQTSFESFFGIADIVGTSYGATVTDTSNGTSGLDSVWFDDMPVAIEEESYPWETGMYWSFGSRPGVSADGKPYFVGGFTNVQGGSTTNRGLFLGTDASAVLVGGDMVDGLPDPVSSGGSNISFDYRFSAFASHWIAEVATETGSSNTDNSMVLDGAVALSDGLPVTEGSSFPETSGGLPGENWDSFDFAGVTESGNWMITGNTDIGGALDEFIVLDGSLAHREGDSLDDEILTGAIEGAYMNEDGDYAFIWDIDDGVGGSLEALFLGERLLLVEGDPVDWDNDGIIDEGTMLDNFTGITSLTLSDRDDDGIVRACFTADVEVPTSLIAGNAHGSVTAGIVGFDSERESDLEPGLGSERDGIESAAKNDSGTSRSHDESRAGGTEVLEGFFSVSVETATSSAPEILVNSRSVLEARPSVLQIGGQTTLDFSLSEPANVHLTIHDVSGQLVRSFGLGHQRAGKHAVRWDGRENDGSTSPAGVYWARLEAGDESGGTRITLLH